MQDSVLDIDLAGSTLEGKTLPQTSIWITKNVSYEDLSISKSVSIEKVNSDSSSKIYDILNASPTINYMSLSRNEPIICGSSYSFDQKRDKNIECSDDDDLPISKRMCADETTNDKEIN